MDMGQTCLAAEACLNLWRKEMSKWNGPAGKGAMKKVRQDKRQEAEIRQAEEIARNNLRDAEYLEAVKKINDYNWEPEVDLLKAIFTAREEF